MEEEEFVVGEIAEEASMIVEFDSDSVGETAVTESGCELAGAGCEFIGEG